MSRDVAWYSICHSQTSFGEVTPAQSATTHTLRNQEMRITPVSCSRIEVTTGMITQQTIQPDFQRFFYSLTCVSLLVVLLLFSLFSLAAAVVVYLLFPQASLKGYWSFDPLSDAVSGRSHKFTPAFRRLKKGRNCRNAAVQITFPDGDAFFPHV